MVQGVINVCTPRLIGEARILKFQVGQALTYFAMTSDRGEPLTGN
jgi:hypothetical protein